MSRRCGRLGESFDSIKASNAPLEQVTTGNLEALKAYSLAIKALATGDPRNAVTLLNRAVELDPDFSTAHAKLAGVYLTADDEVNLDRRTEERRVGKE